VWSLKRWIGITIYKTIEVLCLTAACVLSVLSQTIPQGITPGSTQITAGPVNIDMATGNMVVDIPVRHKTGAFPFGFDLIDNAGNQGAANSISAIQWSMPSTGMTGFNPPSSTVCGVPPNTTLQFGNSLPNQWSLSDGTGAAHPFTFPNIRVGPSSCGGAIGPVTETANDGSGYTAVVTGSNSSTGHLTWTVYNKDGISLVGGASLGTWTDPDNNSISASKNGNTWTWTDTLGQPAMSMVYNGPGATGDQYSYTDGSGTTQHYNVAYSPQHVKTVFGCGSPYGDSDTTGVYLPNSVTTPVGTYSFTYEKTGSQYGSDVTGRLKSVTFPTGGSVSFAYSGGTAGFNCTSRVIPTLTVTINDNNGNSNTTTYTNSNTSNYQSPCCANFTVTVKSNPDPDNGGAQNVTVNSFNGEWLTQSVAYEGPATGTPLSIVQTCYNGNTTSCATPASPVGGQFGNLITQKNTFTVYNSSSLAGANEVITTYDCKTISPCYGNVTSVAKYDWSQVLLSTTTLTYGGCGTGGYVFDRPCSVATSGPSGNPVSRALYTYNASGHPTQTQRLVSGTTYLTSHASYSASNGTLLTTTDPNTKITTYNYDGSCNSLVPTSTTFPATTYGGVMTTSQTWDCGGGVVTSTTDANTPGNVTHFYYNDPLWRQTEVDYPDGGVTKTFYNDTASPPNVQVNRLMDNSSHWLTSQTNLDGVGRPIQKSLTSDPGGTVFTDTIYDVLGRVASVSNPHRSISNPTDGTTGFTYDALGRPLVITNPDSTTRNFTYTQRASKIVDEGNGSYNVTHIYQNDGLGRLKNVCEVSGTTQANSTSPSACGLDISGTGFLTTYSYDPLGNLSTVAQPGISNRTYAYDGLSRLTQEVNPESGTTTYAYNATSGDPYTRTRGNGVVSTYTYDVLHRLTFVSSSDGTTNTFSYDRADSGKGPIAANPNFNLTYVAATNNGFSYTIFSYDSVKRAQDTWQCTPKYCNANAFNTHYTYDFVGDILSASDGEGHTYTYQYNTAAQLTNVTSSLNIGIYPGTLANSFQYDPFGHQTSATLGNGLISQHTYSNRGWLNSAQVGTTTNPTSAYSLVVSHAPDGDVTRANDSANGNWQYTYDDLNRLTCAGIPVCPYNSSQTEGFAYSYDQFGNRWHAQLTAGSGLNINLTYTNGRNQIDGVTYDGAGNMTNSGSFTYNADGRLISDGVYSLSYDGLGNMVEQKNLSSGSTLDYIFQGTHEITSVDGNGVWSRGEVYAQGGHVNTYANGDIFFAHDDQIGTTRVRTNHGGAIVQHCENDPFGTYFLWCGGAWESDIYYTGQLGLDDGMIVFPARSFHSQSGHFMVPDPAGLAAVDPRNPQTWNRYAYVLNNPTSLTDPSGLLWQENMNGGWDQASFCPIGATCISDKDTATVSNTVVVGSHANDDGTTTTVTQTTTATFATAKGHEGEFLGAATQSAVTSTGPIGGGEPVTTTIATSTPARISLAEAIQAIGARALTDAQQRAVPSFAAQFGRVTAQDFMAHPAKYAFAGVEVLAIFTPLPEALAAIEGMHEVKAVLDMGFAAGDLTYETLEALPGK
jgi:RHS repeat-associated protein